MIETQCRVLLVDDEPNSVDLLKELIESLDMNLHIETATTVDYAVELIQNQPEYDVVVTDMRMPTPGDSSDAKVEGEEGLEVVRTARGRSPWTEIIVVTAFPTASNIHKAMQYGADNYFDKVWEADMRIAILEYRFKKAANSRRYRERSNDALNQMPTAEQAMMSIDDNALNDTLRYALSKRNNQNWDTQLHLIQGNINSLQRKLEAVQQGITSVVADFRPFVEGIGEIERRQGLND